MPEATRGFAVLRGGVAAMALATGRSRIGSAITPTAEMTAPLRRDPARVEIAAMVICSVSDDEEQARREAAAQLGCYAAPHE